MNRYAAAALLLLPLVACQTPGPASLAELGRASDWSLDDGDALAYRFQRDMRRLLVGRSVSDALSDLRSDGYDCNTGEAHEDHRGPLSVCRKSFATRACELDWEVSLAAEDAAIFSVDTGFARDCIGKDRDWPEAKLSAIDNGRAQL